MAKTNEQFVEEYYKKFPNSTISFLGTYINSKTKIPVRCNVCNNEWNPIPGNLLKGCGCKDCNNKKAIKQRTFTKKDFEDKYFSKFPDSQIKVLGEYITAKTKIECKCKKCNYEWSPTPDNLMSGKGCPKCNNNSGLKKTTQEFKDEYYSKYPNSNTIIIGEYKGARTKIKCKCKKCSYEWETNPDTLLRGSGGCYKCTGHIAKTTQDFIKEYQEKFPNSNISIIGEYIKENIPIKCKCNICNNEWETTTPHRLLNGCGCNKCSNSKGNNIIKDILNSNNIEFIEEMKFEDCKGKGYLRYDFFLPKYNIIIEYDGEQHFTATSFYGGQDGFEQRIEYDNIKNNYCKDNNILLLRIPCKYKPTKHKNKIEKIILSFTKTYTIPNEIKKFYDKYEFSNYLKVS